jgi:hypothetical protein
MKTLLLAVCFAVASSAISSAEETAAPFPLLQYDEISRAVLPGETLPAPSDAFTTDYAHAHDGKITSKIAQSAMPQIPKPHFGFGDILSAAFNPMAALMNVGLQMAMGGIMGAMMGGMMRGEMESGRLYHFAYFEGSMRSESLADKTAMIFDAKTRTGTQLDLAKQQYKLVPQQTAGEAIPPAGEPATRGDGDSATIDLNTQRTQGVDAVIAGVETTEYDVVTTVTIPNGSGSCNNMKMRMETTEYVADTVLGPSGSTGMFATLLAQHPEYFAGSACSGKVTSSDSGPQIPENHFVIYSRTVIVPDMPGADKAAAHAPQIAMVVERGNIKPVSAEEARTLFSVPAGFAQQP